MSGLARIVRVNADTREKPLLESAGAAGSGCGTRLVISGLVGIGSSSVSAGRHRALLADAACATVCGGAEAGQPDSEQE
jgi:hypothetical protein